MACNFVIKEDDVQTDDGYLVDPTYNKPTVKHWEDFANAIVLQAAHDYERGITDVMQQAERYTLLETNKVSKDYNIVYRKHELELSLKSRNKFYNIITIEKFFNSDYFRILTNDKIDPIYVLNGIRRRLHIPLISQ